MRYKRISDRLPLRIGKRQFEYGNKRPRLTRHLNSSVLNRMSIIVQLYVGHLLSRSFYLYWSKGGAETFKNLIGQNYTGLDNLQN